MRPCHALILLSAACAGSAVPPSGGVATERASTGPFSGPEMSARLADLATAPAMRLRLAAGLTDRELNHVGFDEVTIAQCIDRIVAAELARRGRPEDQLVLGQLDDAVGLYHAAKREAYVRRGAGAANCIPVMR